MTKDLNKKSQSPIGKKPSVKKVDNLKNKLFASEEEKKRILADYQNLVRRTRDDRIKLINMANKDLVISLLQPLQHLEMAAVQISDPGLEMVITQFKQNLEVFGLEEIEVMGKEFDLETMEAVEIAEQADNQVKDAGGKTKVIKVSQKGYKLNGEVIQHAKVVLG